MYAEITTDTETIVMSTRTALIGRGRPDLPTIWQVIPPPPPPQPSHKYEEIIKLTSMEPLVLVTLGH